MNGLKQISHEITVSNGVCFLTSSQINWADIKNCAAFLLKELLDIKMNDNCPFEELRRLNVYLNSDKLEQWKNQHVKIDKNWVEVFNLFKNEHIS